MHSLASHINQMINLAAVMYDEIKSHHELSEHVVFRRTLCAVGGNEQARKKTSQLDVLLVSVEYPYNKKHTFAL